MVARRRQALSVCPVCRRSITVTAAGLVRVHGPVSARCAGSREAPCADPCPATDVDVDVVASHVVAAAGGSDGRRGEGAVVDGSDGGLGAMGLMVGDGSGGGRGEGAVGGSVGGREDGAVGGSGGGRGDGAVCGFTGGGGDGADGGSAENPSKLAASTFVGAGSGEPRTTVHSSSCTAAGFVPVSVGSTTSTGVTSDVTTVNPFRPTCCRCNRSGVCKNCSCQQALLRLPPSEPRQVRQLLHHKLPSSCQLKGLSSCPPAHHNIGAPRSSHN